MAKTLLDGVNELGRRVGLIQGDSGVFSSLTDSPRQQFIDVAVQVFNELVDDVYSRSDRAHPIEMDEDTIILISNKRNYPLRDEVTRLFWPMLDETNGQYITEYPGSYIDMVNLQPFPDNEKGLPRMGAWNPNDGFIYLDNIPQSAEAGKVYKYRFSKDLVMTLSTDRFPFADVVFRAIMPAAAELWRLNNNREFDRPAFDRSVGRAVRYLSKVPRSGTWNPRHVSIRFNTDPFNAN